MKRLFDFVVAAVAAIVLSPVIAVIALLVRIKLGKPVLFRQLRPGLHGQPFTLLKFRTMLDAVDSNGSPLPDAERLTAFGQFLRRWSLDELPELYNVLRGDMSLVGPRPLLDGISAAVHCGAGAAARRPPRTHRLGAGQWPQRDQLGSEIRASTCGTSSMRASRSI